eukprot:TRINITY_DN14950_c0_g2_i3.p1 TRINITY_DN14950_c0_g2~~TRINITY_DN14950_c0_g2_i3.p1  ORF type:complete len:449 (-),score=115.59 TRINITY_DN14950_c0_g2_i3:197-1420(-)
MAVLVLVFLRAESATPLEAAREKVAKADAASVTAADVQELVSRGFHEDVRQLVELSHKGTQEDSQRVAAQVRQAVTEEKHRLDNLIRALDRNYGKAVDVSPAAQWAQNSSHIFIAVKFAQRWNAPGALEVENATVDMSDCCLNFTAYGEHSLIKRRYHLSWEMNLPILPKASSWHMAAAGRMTVTMAKVKNEVWKSLLKGTAPKNLGVWRDMQETWRADIEGTQESKKEGKEKPKKETTKGKKKKAKKEEEEDDDDAIDREEELLSRCDKATYAGSGVKEVCEKAFPGVVKRPAVKGRSWVVQLYSGDGDGDTTAARNLIGVWKRLADVLPTVQSKARVAAMDCSKMKDLCSELLGVPEASWKKVLPKIMRFREGYKPDAYEQGLDSSLEDFAAWGSEPPKQKSTEL